MINEKIIDPDYSYVFGSTTSIANRTSSNPYTCPSDGYVRWTASSAVNVLVNSTGMMANAESKYASIFVKKGLKVYFSATPSAAIFIPIKVSS